jgi:hypothetical protein
VANFILSLTATGIFTRFFDRIRPQSVCKQLRDVMEWPHFFRGWTVTNHRRISEEMRPSLTLSRGCWSCASRLTKKTAP